jgi:hypothetical protein
MDDFGLTVHAFRWTGGVAGPLARAIYEAIEKSSKVADVEQVVADAARWTVALASAGARIEWHTSGAHSLRSSTAAADFISARMPDGRTRSFDMPSTGSLGNITPIVVPIMVMAQRGDVFVPKMSSEGGVTGTIDVLQSVGFRSNLSIGRYVSLLRKNGIANIAQTPDLAFADRLLMHLRRQRGLMSSPPLVVSSILSKKIATGCRNVLVDVKSGPGVSKLSNADNWDDNLRETDARARIFEHVHEQLRAEMDAASRGRLRPAFFDSVRADCAGEAAYGCMLSELSCVGRLLCLVRAHRILSGEEGPSDSMLTRRCVALRDRALEMLDGTEDVSSDGEGTARGIFMAFLEGQAGNADALVELSRVELTDKPISAEQFYRQAAEYLGLAMPEISPVKIPTAQFTKGKLGAFVSKAEQVLKFMNRREDHCFHTASLFLPALMRGTPPTTDVEGWVSGPRGAVEQARAVLEEG